MVTLSSADKVLKNVYLGVICDQLNKRTNPFYAAIQQGSELVNGKNAVAIIRNGINGGVGSGTESGALPAAKNSTYYQLIADLKNIYGTIEISDKALRASQNSANALVNLLNDEMEALLDSAKFNFGRMLWQNGSGVLTKVASLEGHSSTSEIPVEDTRNLMEGMTIDFADGNIEVSTGHTVSEINRADKIIRISPALSELSVIQAGTKICLQGSNEKEIYGLPYLFDHTISMFYNTPRSLVPAILPQTTTVTGELSSEMMQTALDDLEIASGNETDMILGSHETRKKYFAYLQTTRTNIDYMNLDGGFKALSYNGIPFVADRFCPDGEMYFVNTKDFRLASLCDWQWIEGENGRILTQIEKTPTYMATLVKYANLICVRPKGQACIKGFN